MRILRSYAAGESTDIEVMRKKRKRKLTYKAPERPAIGGGPGYHYNFMAPDGSDAEVNVIIERGEGEGGDRQIVIKKIRKIVGEGDGEVVIEAEAPGT